MIISNLPAKEQRVHELGRQAAFLINQLNRAEITRVDILKKIDALEESEQAIFKDLLNKYRAVK